MRKILLALVALLFVVPAYAQFADQRQYAATSTGSGNAQAVAIPNYNLNVGVVVRFVPGFTNTGAMTLSVNGGVAKNVLVSSYAGLVALTAGQVTAGQVAQVVYDGTQFELLNPPLGALATLVPGTGVATALTNALNNSSGLLGATSPQLPGLSSSVQGSGFPGLDQGVWFIHKDVSVADSLLHVFRSDRNDNYTGGTGVVYNTWTACNESAGVTSFVYCGLDTLDNNATSTSSNYVTRYTQAFRENGAGSTWAQVSELRDYTPNPVSAAVPYEVDLWAKDGDSNLSRVVLDLVAGPIPGLVGHNPTIGTMLTLGAQFGAESVTTILHGITFKPGIWGTLIDARSITAQVGIDLTGCNCTTAQVKLTNLTIDTVGNATAFGTWAFGNTGANAASFAGKVLFAASSATQAGVNLGQGSAPSAPANGDIWITSTGLFYRFNGTTHGPL